MNKSEIHAGYEFEEGMFSRMRSWVDVAPWVRLIRVLRLLASPTYVGLVAIAAGVTQAVMTFGLGVPLPASSSDLELIGDTLLELASRDGSAWTAFYLVAAFLLWTPILQIVARAGAALTVGKNLPAQAVGRKIMWSRLWQSYLIPVVPIGCMLMFAVVVWLARVPGLIVDNEALQKLIGWIIGIGAIPIGVLGFGALFAIPVGLIAMVVEPDPDPIDSLSRGYEYLYRRPLSMMWYLAVAGLLIYLAGLLLGGVAWASCLAVTAIASVLSPDAIELQSAFDAIETILIAWKIAFSFGLLGGVYLLLRHDAGGQEVEDFWTPNQPAGESLPELPKEALQS